MSPRSWVVGRLDRRAVPSGAPRRAVPSGAPRHAARVRRARWVACAFVVSSCGQVGYSAAPEPEFTSGLPPATTVAGETPSVVTAEEPDLAAIERDESSDALDLRAMVVVDDAGQVTANDAGWAEFDERMRSRLGGNWSSSVAVMIDGAVVHRSAFGERVAGTGEAAEPTDRFRIASISKTITAITTLRLVEQGVLSLDAPIGDTLVAHLGVVDADVDASAITVRGLLSHTAGIGKGQDLMFGNGAASYVDAAAQALRSVGGNGYNYSNLGYALLTVLIEAVTGRAYERVVNDELFEPLGIEGMRMTSTYELGPDEVSHFPRPGRLYMEALGGAGAWNATPADLVAIANSIDPKTPGWKALSPEMMTAMRSRLPTGGEPSGYGLGLINYGGGTFGHTGTIENTHAMVLVQPDGVTWAVTVSGNSPSESESLRGIVQGALRATFPG
jgi:D-alanyl-D-alanine carboxypeptidase